MQDSQSSIKTTFPKSERLLNAADYRFVFDNASIRASHPSLLILSRPNQKTQARLGVIVAKKNIKKAVRRNRIKRIVRESFRHQRNYLPPIDVIVLARSSADTLKNDEVFSILVGLWKRVSKKHAKLARNTDQ